MPKFKASCVFSPGEKVEIVAFGLNLKGQIDYCCFGRNGVFYEVEYALDKEIKKDYFYADQIASLEEDIKT